MHAGDVVWNPLTGEKALLVESAEESGGARIVVDFVVEAGGFVPGGEHVHDHCAEHLAVQSGQIRFAIAGQERVVGPGEEVVVAPGTWHRWWNPGDAEVALRVRVEPALRFEEAMLVIWGLCADGRTNAKGVPSSPLLAALVATRYRGVIRYRQPPDLVQRTLLPALAAIARRSRLDRALDRYLDLTTHPSAEPARGELPERIMRPA